MQPVTITAPAKVNLYLHVTGRRDDGYHELESLVTFCDLYDVVKISPDTNFSFSCDGPYSEFIDKDDNLCIRAAKYFAQKYNKEVTCHIHLTKNIPIAAGLGGGSSDAAAVLLGLQQAYCKDNILDNKEVANHLGADVPVCYKKRSVIMTGIGESFENFKIPEFYFLLANPNKKCCTKEVFQGFDGDFHAPSNFKSGVSDLRELKDLLAKTENQLFEPAQIIVPEIESLINDLEILDGCIAARLSGSGATCFGVFADESSAQNAANSMRSKYPDYWQGVYRKI